MSWPNKHEIIDGVVLVDLVPQEPHPFNEDVDADLEREMEV